MDLNYNDDQLLLHETVRGMLATECEAAHLKKMLLANLSYDDDRAGLLREMGLWSSLAPESVGGGNLASIEFCIIAECCGYAAVPEPIVEQGGVAIPLLASLNDDRGWLQRAAEGRIVAVGHPIHPFVSDADRAEALILSDGCSIHLVERRNVVLTRQPSLDPFRQLFKVGWSPSTGTAVALAGQANQLWAAALNNGALYAAAQCLGLTRRLIDMAVAYAKQRMQFGKVIGSYQAVKHALANAQVKLEFAHPVLRVAAATHQNPSNAIIDARISHAKLRALEAADLAARTALQVHGAFGYTLECDLHLFFKRVRALTFAWGTPDFHRRRVNLRLDGYAIGPEQTFGNPAVAQ